VVVSATWGERNALTPVSRLTSVFDGPRAILPHRHHLATEQLVTLFPGPLSFQEFLSTPMTICFWNDPPFFDSRPSRPDGFTEIPFSRISAECLLPSLSPQLGSLSAPASSPDPSGRLVNPHRAFPRTVPLQIVSPLFKPRAYAAVLDVSFPVFAPLFS